MLIILLQSRVDVYSAHCPAGTSVQNMIHWSQVEFPESKMSMAVLLVGY